MKVIDDFFTELRSIGSAVNSLRSKVCRVNDQLENIYWNLRPSRETGAIWFEGIPSNGFRLIGELGDEHKAKYCSHQETSIRQISCTKNILMTRISAGAKLIGSNCQSYSNPILLEPHTELEVRYEFI